MPVKGLMLFCANFLTDTCFAVLLTGAQGNSIQHVRHLLSRPTRGYLVRFISSHQPTYLQPNSDLSISVSNAYARKHNTID